MGFSKRKMEDRRRQEAEKEAAARRATERQILEDAEHLIAVWNDRQAKRMPMLFSPTIGAAITAGYWFLRARCPACRTTGRRRPADARLAPRRGRDSPYPGAVLPILPAERAVRRTRLPVQVERGRGVLRGAQRQSVGHRVIERLTCGPEPDVGGSYSARGHRARRRRSASRRYDVRRSRLHRGSIALTSAKRVGELAANMCRPQFGKDNSQLIREYSRRRPRCAQPGDRKTDR
jgi:hypothetical protein